MLAQTQYSPCNTILEKPNNLDIDYLFDLAVLIDVISIRRIVPHFTPKVFNLSASAISDFSNNSIQFQNILLMQFAALE